MYRTLIVENGEELSVEHNVLQVKNRAEAVPIPLDDIYCIVLDNNRTVISTWAINAICSCGGHMVICNEKHMPSVVIYPEMIHYKPYAVVKEQVQMTEGVKNALWDKIVRAKLCNQAFVLEKSCGEKDIPNRIRQLAEEVKEGDEGNREGIGAKMYFRRLFGEEFIRMNDDGINSAMNYGYAILRSAVVKTLYLYGYYPALGIHHIGIYNPFNLGDDLMEPFRPVIDMWVDLHHLELESELSKEQRHQLVNLLNVNLEYNHKKMKLRNVINAYIKSFTSAIQSEDIRKFNPPELNDVIMEEMRGGICHDL